MVVANVLEVKSVASDVSHFERSPLNTVAPLNTDPKSNRHNGTIPQLEEWSNKNQTKLKRGRRKNRTNYKRDKKKHSILLVCG